MNLISDCLELITFVYYLKMWLFYPLKANFFLKYLNFDEIIFNRLKTEYRNRIKFKY